MSKGYFNSLPSCKQSFKAAENCLRRVAFNLGNTRSMTEVKIISCIPIDVTDLQQKIFELQTELANIKKKEEPVTCSSCTKRDEICPEPVLCNECLLSTTSVLSVFCSGGRASTQFKQSESSELLESRLCLDSVPKTEGTSSKYKSFFGKKKKYKKKGKSRLIYCAQTDTKSPFNRKFDELAAMQDKAGNKSENLNRLYLADVIKRLYQNQPLKTEFSNLSEISSPVCRDHVPASAPTSPYFESDACSCFHDKFQNIDKYMNHKNNGNKYSMSETVGKIDRNAYYDSKFYDLIPVKEKKNKNRNDINNHKGRAPNKHLIECWPEKARPKHKYRQVVNYCTVSSLRNERQTAPTRLLDDKHGRKNRNATKRLIASTPRRTTELDLGPVYAKQVREPKKQNIITITTQRHTEATRSPAENNGAAHHTVTTGTTITDPPEDKTQTTLDQIKNMLQTVLNEVKTQSETESPPVKAKKDAVVQNGPSQCFDYGTSKLIQSYTYSPYNMDPFQPSCSHPISIGNYVCPDYQCAQGIPLHQYPLLIQPQKHLCNNSYRIKNFTKPVPKQAACAATNTEKTQERSKETEQLIKEIYKSMALTLDRSSKDNSYREHTKPKVTARNYVDVAKMESNGDSRSIAQAISEIFRNSHPQESTVTETTDTTLNSYLSPDETIAVAEDAVIKDYKTERNYSQNVHSTKFRKDREQELMTTYNEAEEQSEQTDYTVAENTEESSTGTESADAGEDKEPAKQTEAKKEKSGIFKKMLKIFQSRRRRRRKDDESDRESESDSDGYQTIYSHKVVDSTPKPKKGQTVRSRPHSKVFYSKQPQKKRSRTNSPEKNARTTPNMEQEYRRYWDETLMFREKQHPKYSTDVSRPTARQDKSQRNRHPFYQNYETRPILVNPTRQMPPRMPRNVCKPYYQHMYTASKTHYPRLSENYNESRPYNHQSNPNYVRYTTDGNAGTTGPHFVTSKNNSNRKTMFAKGLLNKCKPRCAQELKNLIING